jgi:hypothetical protein
MSMMCMVAMSYTHRVQYTKNILNGPNQGEQRYAFHNLPTAQRAIEVALELNQGIHRDPWTGEAFTAHNIDHVSIEEELPELVTESEWGRYDQADMAMDLAQEVR